MRSRLFLNKLSLSILSAALLASCTLSMEEWAIPEEQRGQGEIYTEENDYGSISYQFADSVLYVTENIQEQYLVRVEEDSILYFSDQIPEEWRPYVGQKMAAGISHLLPYGLNSRVISVENAGGFIKAVTTRVDLETVYKHLKYSFDGYASLPDIDAEQIDSIDLEDYGFEMKIDPETGDTTITDWNDYDIKKGLRPAYARRRSLRQTRADEKPEEEKLPEDGIKRSELLDISFDTRDIGKYTEAKGFMSAIKNKFYLQAEKAARTASASSKNGEIFAAAKFKVTHFSKFHAIKDTDAGIEDEWTDTWSEWDYGLEIGYAYKKVFGKFDEDEDKALGFPMYGFTDMIRKRTETFGRCISPVRMMKKPFRYLKLRIPIVSAPTAIAIILEGSITPTFEFGGSACLAAKYTSDVLRNGSHIIKGKVQEKYEDKVISKGHFDYPTPIINGFYKAGVKARIAAGFEVGGTAGITIGANVEGYVEGNASFKIYEVKDIYNHPYIQWGKFSGTPFKFYVDVYGDVTVFVAPFGIELWDKQLTKFLTKRLINEDPETTTGIKNKGGDSYFGTELGKKLEGDYWDDEVGYLWGWYIPHNELSPIVALMGSSKYYPAMKMYIGDIKNDKWILMKRAADEEGGLFKPSSQWSTIRNDEQYLFRYFTSVNLLKQISGLEKVENVYLVPTYVSLKSDDILHTDYNFDDKPVQEAIDEMVEVKDASMMIDLAKPNISTIDAQHLESKDMDGIISKGTYISKDKGGVQKAGKENEVYVRKYSFYSCMMVQGGSYMKEWGLTVYVLSPSKKWLLKKIIPVNKCRSGRYTFLFSFYSDWAPQSVANEDGDNIAKLYFRVIPYWVVELEGETMTIQADDKRSTKIYPIEYFCDNEANYWDNIVKNKGLFGEPENIVLTP